MTEQEIFNPDLINYLAPEERNTSETVRLETVVVDPISFSGQRYIQFRIPKRGLLHNDGIFSIDVTCTLPEDRPQMVRYKYLSGANACIKNVSLKVDGKPIHNILNSGLYMTIKQRFSSPDYLSGHLVNSLFCDDYFQVSSTNRGEYFSYDYSLDTEEFLDNYVVDNSVLTSACPYFKLSDLFPLLQVMQLPMGDINGDIVVDIELENTPDRVLTYGDDIPEGYVKNITYANPRLVLNYVHFPPEFEQRITNKLNKVGEVHTYTDVMTFYDNLAGGANNVRQELVSYLNVKDKFVSNLYITKLLKTNGPDGIDAREGLIYSKELMMQEFNVNINNKDLFTRNVQLPALTYHLLGETVGSPFAVYKPFYTATTYTGNPAAYPELYSGNVAHQPYKANSNSQTLAGKYNFIGVNLRNTRVLNSALEVRLARTPQTGRDATSADDVAIIYHVEIQRSLMIKNGSIQLSY